MLVRLRRRINKTFLVCLLLFAVAIAAYTATGEGHPNNYNYYVRLADDFLHGRLYLTQNFSWLNELVPYDNATKFYVVYPPLPAFLMTPLVAIFGLTFDQTLVSLFFGASTVVLAYLVARGVLKKPEDKGSEHKQTYIWTATMFGFGTIFFWLASTGSVWLTAQVISAFFLFLAIHEAFGKARPLLMGLFVGASFWCRLPTILGIFFFAGLIVARQPNPQWLAKLRASLRSLVQLGIGAGIFVAFDMVYNFVRFGALFDVAYWMIPGILNERWFSHGLFSLAYIPDNLVPFLGGLPTFTSVAPFIGASMTGLAIWFTTPAFLFSLKSKLRDAVTWSAWIAIIAIAFVIFTKGLSGWGWGYRYAMDFYPFLYVLTIRGMGEKLKWYHKVLIIFGIVFNAWGAFAINRFPGANVLH
jgi:hypothetical protein